MITSEVKSKWIAALRSGEYAQGSGSLVDTQEEDGTQQFCCLGVLGLICGITIDDMERQSDLGDVEREDLLGPWNDPADHARSFMSDNPATHTTLQRKLAGMNDTGKTFPEIADWIDTNVPVDTAFASSDETEGEANGT